MNRIEAIHTAARRYCIERHRHWAERYSRGAWTESEGKGIFPRYLVLDAILKQVERRTAADFTSCLELQEYLVAAGRSASDGMTLNLVERADQAAISAMSAERMDFETFMIDLASAENVHVAPLPYRRVISVEESLWLRGHLRSRWGIGRESWYPLSAAPPPTPVLALHTDYFAGHREGATLLRSMLSSAGLTTAYELRETDNEPEYEIDVSIIEFAYTGAEGYWTAPPFDWVVFASHESSVTIGGERLITPLKERWTDWNERSYQGPFSTSDMRGTWKWEK